MLIFIALLAVAQAELPDGDAPALETSSLSGADLARAFLHELRDGTLAKDDARRRFIALAIDQRDACLSEWARLTKPIEPALGVFRLMRNNRDVGADEQHHVVRPKDERAQPSRDWETGAIPPQRGLDAADRAVLFRAAEKSATLAWALSFFLGHGIGNFYADAPTYAVLVLLTRIVGYALIAGGISEDAGAAIAIGALLNIGGWIADWSGAIVHANAYNDRLMKQMTEAGASEPGTSHPSLPVRFVVSMPF